MKDLDTMARELAPLVFQKMQESLCETGSDDKRILPAQSLSNPPLQHTGMTALGRCGMRQ
jgi:hypothetical protein